MKGAGIEPTVPAGSYQGPDNPQMSHIIRSNECQTRLWPQIDIPASGVFNMQKKIHCVKIFDWSMSLARHLAPFYQTIAR